MSVQELIERTYIDFLGKNQLPNEPGTLQMTVSVM